MSVFASPEAAAAHCVRFLMKIHCRACPLRLSGRFTEHSDAEIGLIERFKKDDIEVRAGQPILREGEVSSTLYTLLAGWAFRYRTLSDGRRQIFNVLLPGDFMGLHDQLGGPLPYGIEALTDSALCVFPLGQLMELYSQSPTLGFDVTWLCAHEEFAVGENLLSVGRRSALERIATLLIHLYMRADSLGLGGPDGVPFPLTQQHVADALGLSLVHTSKTMKRLQAQGLFRIAAGRLIVTHPVEMAALAEYSPRPLRHRPLI